MSPKSKIQEIAIADISVDWSKRLRRPTEAGVQNLIESIQLHGEMTTPIFVRRKRRKKVVIYELIAGGHRIKAAELLGWKTIAARVWSDIPDDFARIMEVDENLARAELSTLEMSVSLAEHKRVYERLHPETKRGIAGSTGRWGATEHGSFAKVIAEKRGITERQVRKIAAAGATLSTSEIALLENGKCNVTLNDLLKIADLTEPKLRAAVIGKLADGTAKNAVEAIQSDDSPLPPKDKIEAAHLDLMERFRRAPKQARDRLLRDITPKPELPEQRPVLERATDLLSEMYEGQRFVIFSKLKEEFDPFKTELPKPKKE